MLTNSEIISILGGRRCLHSSKSRWIETPSVGVFGRKEPLTDEEQMYQPFLKWLLEMNEGIFKCYKWFFAILFFEWVNILCCAIQQSPHNLFSWFSLALMCRFIWRFIYVRLCMYTWIGGQRKTAIYLSWTIIYLCIWESVTRRILH